VGLEGLFVNPIVCDALPMVQDIVFGGAAL
jgi:hypothetical protein